MAKGKKTGGRKKGTPNKATLDKIAAREYVRRRVTEQLSALLDAQFANAKGIHHLMMRDPKTGKFERVATDANDPEAAAAQVDAALATGNAFWIFTKDPSVQAFTDLLNRALDKPKEQELEVKLSGELEVVTAELLAARKRLAARQS